MRFVDFKPRNVRFSLDDGPTIPIRKVTSIVAKYDDRDRLASVMLTSFDVSLARLLEAGARGDLTLELPTPLPPLVGGGPDGPHWIEQGYRRLEVLSNHPSWAEGEFALVTIVFAPAD